MSSSAWPIGKNGAARVIIVRLFNTVGPRQSSRYGMVLPNFVRRALQGAPIMVHGDGSQTRSFTWVGDVVAAMQLLANAPEAIGEVFNVGNGAEISIGELAHKVRAMAGSVSPIEYVPYDQVFDDSFEDMPRRVPDITKIKAYVGYKPTVALDEIIQHVIAYWMTAARLTRRASVDAPGQPHACGESNGVGAAGVQSRVVDFR